MKNILPILIVGILVLSGLGAVALPNTPQTQRTHGVLFVSEPMIQHKDQFVRVRIPEQASYLMETGKPMIPVLVWSQTFEPNTQFSNIKVQYTTQPYQLAAPLEPAPHKVPLSKELADMYSPQVSMDATVYSSNDLYPSEPYTITQGIGLDNNNNHVVYLTVRITPQYSPAQNIIYVPSGEIDIDVSYIPPEKPYFTGRGSNMLIITSEKFFSLFDPLIAHKNAKGIATIIDTVENIKATYTTGRNLPEQIKLRIKDAIEIDGISYVLLGGGRKGQTLQWIVPEFRNNNDDGWESGFAADLYYADIYKIVGSNVTFDDWDSNGNQIFGEYLNFKKDIIDGYPDVHVGRLSFHYGFELKNIINKIIAYETGEKPASWFKKVICIAGDTFPASNPYYEGEIETGLTATNFQNIGYAVEKLWTSEGTLTGESDVIEAISAGAGFVHFAGHGNPSTWSTHPPQDEEIWINGLSLKHIQKLTNKEKTPFVLVGGCHNAQFNTTMSEILVGIRTYGFMSYFGLWKNHSKNSYRFYYMEWVPRDWSSWFLLKKKGGSIGTIGMSSLGYGYIDQHTTEGLGGWIEPRFYHAYTVQGLTKAGDCHDRAISDYITIIGGINTDNIDRKTIEAFTLLGDPSLQFGGYP
ncbi:MAG: C25 family cysteine peptidase [Candidatus Thermoplasmatota archaeon]